MVGLAVCGLGNAVHFPLGIALAVAHSGGQPELALSRTTYAICIALSVAPFALGAIADRVGPHTAILLVAGFLAVSATAVTRLLLLPPAGERAAADELVDVGCEEPTAA